MHYSVGGRAIFAGLNMSIPRGRITAIMGPSGTGKTTLLRLMTGQIKPDRGQILFDGVDVSQLGVRELYALRRRMGMLFQNGALLTDHRRVRERRVPVARAHGSAGVADSQSSC